MQRTETNSTFAPGTPRTAIDLGNEGLLIFAPEVLRLLQVSRFTLWRWVNTQRFPAPLDWPGRRNVWRRATVREFIERMPARAEEAARA